MDSNEFKNKINELLGNTPILPYTDEKNVDGRANRDFLAGYFKRTPSWMDFSNPIGIMIKYDYMPYTSKYFGDVVDLLETLISEQVLSYDLLYNEEDKLFNKARKFEIDMLKEYYKDGDYNFKVDNIKTLGHLFETWEEWEHIEVAIEDEQACFIIPTGKLELDDWLDLECYRNYGYGCLSHDCMTIAENKHSMCKKCLSKQPSQDQMRFYVSDNKEHGLLPFQFIDNVFVNQDEDFFVITKNKKVIFIEKDQTFWFRNEPENISYFAGTVGQEDDPTDTMIEKLHISVLNTAEIITENKALKLCPALEVYTQGI